ncbi:MAG: murein biosynthesis integral membrane protein MurJ, partial [Leucobacter sp.]
MAGNLMRASAVMASGTMVSRVLGLVKAILLAYAIGSVGSVSADAFQNGNLLPNTLYMILLGGMLNAVLVPQIVKAARNADGGAGYINKILTLISVGMFAITVLAMIAAPWIVWLTAVAWPPDQLALATAFAYWCLPQIVFYGLYTVLGEVLNARSVFGPFTWAPVLNNVIAIAGILVFIAMFGADPTGELRGVLDWNATSIVVLAGSATLGVIAQALILFWSWRRAGLRYRPDFKWRGMGLGRTARIAAWSLATITVMQLGGLVTNNVVATGSGEGPSTSAMA